MRSLNGIREGNLFYWWRPRRVAIKHEGYREGGNSFQSGLVFDRRDGTDRERKIIAYWGIQHYHVARADVPVLIARIREIKTEKDVIAIVKDYGPLQIDAEYKEPLQLWRWRADTPEEWFKLAGELNEVFPLLNVIEKRLPGADEARSTLVGILSEQVNSARIRTYYSTLTTGEIVATQGVAFDLHAMIWKSVEATATESKAAEFLRLRQCHFCGEWDLQLGGEGSRRMRRERNHSYWYHDGCYRAAGKRLDDSIKAAQEERQRHERPSAKKSGRLPLEKPEAEKPGSRTMEGD